VSGQRRVIVGVSGSPGNLAALRYARSVAEREDALLVAVHAWIPPGGDLSERRFPSPYLRRIWTEDAEQRLGQALQCAWADAEVGVAAERWVARGEAGLVLVGLASDPGDLLVVGAGRRGGLRRLAHGQVTRYCLAHAQGAVLAVPPPVLPRETRLRSWSLRHRDLTVADVIREWDSEKQDHGQPSA
jgi:nucleotide-binding universal stress UspA family protein